MVRHSGPETGCILAQVEVIGQPDTDVGSWTCMTAAGREKVACSVSDLCTMLVE